MVVLLNGIQREFSNRFFLGLRSTLRSFGWEPVSLSYETIERVAPKWSIDLLSKFTDLNERSNAFVKRVLNIFDNIEEWQDHLFDRLPEHSVCRSEADWSNGGALSDFAFLSTDSEHHLIALLLYAAQSTPTNQFGNFSKSSNFWKLPEKFDWPGCPNQ